MSSAEDGIIILEEVSVMRRRISGLLQGYNIRIFEVTYEMQLFNILCSDKNNIRLILMEPGKDAEKSYNTIARIRMKKPMIPIFIITSNNKKENFIRTMAAGASDYILKPFEDYFLLDKILAVFQTSREIKAEDVNISLNIQNYLNAEVKKAQKGKYNITVLLCSFYVSGTQTKSFYKASNINAIRNFYFIYKQRLWDTDIFIHYNHHTFIGVYPYCPEDKVDVIKEKLAHCVREVTRNDPESDNLCLETISATYPAADMEPMKLLPCMLSHLNQSIENLKAGKIEDSTVEQKEDAEEQKEHTEEQKVS